MTKKPDQYLEHFELSNQEPLNPKKTIIEEDPIEKVIGMIDTWIYWLIAVSCLTLLGIFIFH